MEKLYTAAFYTLGCRVNQYETRAVEEIFAARGFRIAAFSEKCDVYVINTCTVTAESDRKSRQLIRRARTAGGKDAVVIALGCMVQVDPDGAYSLDGPDAALGNREKTRCADVALALLHEKREKLVSVTDYTAVKTFEPMRITGADTTRAFVKISDGCENRCAYCIIPRARGPVCSKPVADVVDEVNTLAANGYREIVLTGIETASYGYDLPDTDLCDLIERVSIIDGVERIRLGSLEPTFIKDGNISRLAAVNKLMPHCHLSLQSGSSAVLAAMRRRYNATQFRHVVSLLRAHITDVTVTTDIIVGFPGETEENFAETCDTVRDCRLLFAHIFPYSDRVGTEASARTDKISESVKKARAAALKEIMLDTRRAVIAGFLGSVRPMLVETVRNGIASGYTDNYIELRAKVPQGVKKNDILPVRLLSLSEDAMTVRAEAVTSREV